MPVAHSNISSRLDVVSCECLLERASLLIRDSAKRRSAADLLVIPSREFVPLGRYQPRKRFLERAPRQADDVGIRKQIEQKRSNVVESFRPAEIEQEDTE